MTSSFRKKTILLTLLIAVFLISVYFPSFPQVKLSKQYFLLARDCLPLDAEKNVATRNLTFDNFGNFSLVIAVQVHNRLSYLKQLISSLSQSSNIENAFVIFSHDYYDDNINAVIRNITFCKHKQIFYPYAVEASSNQTNSNRTVKVSQVKLHWWWKANQVFQIIAEYNYDGLVLFLEEDHFVAEDFIHVLNLLQKDSHKHCSNCILSLADGKNKFKLNNFKFTISNRMNNLGLAFNRKTWSTISACSEKFCKYDDYNWDWSLTYIFQECVQPQPKALIMSGSRVFHLGKCGLHYNNDDCDATELVKKFQDEICKYSVLLYPKELKLLKTVTVSKVTRGYGGFNEKEDQELCLKISNLTM